MSPAPRTDEQISEIMRRVKGRDTSPELGFRKALWQRGLRYRLRQEHLAGKPDIGFPTQYLAVFVDGDFWHGNQWRTRRLLSLADQFTSAKNRSYWLGKIERNVKRDFHNTARLLDQGWRVLRFWASDVRSRLEECVEMTAQAVRGEAQPSPAFGSLAHRMVAELFAGIGLARLALENKGWKVIFANDIDPLKLEMYKDNFDGAHFRLGDIHDLKGDDVPTCALATACFPCNDLSLAGAMAGLGGPQSSAFWGLIRILREMGHRRPPLILIENVVGFLMSHRGEDFETALLALNELGYACDPFILNASRFVPQSRPRLFVVGKLRVPGQPTDWFNPSTLRPEALVGFIQSHPNIAWDIRPLPEPETGSLTLEEILEDLPHDHPMWWNTKRAEYFMNQLSERHLAIAKEMILRPHYSYGTAFRRVRYGRSMAELRVDGLAGCLRTPRGGSGRQILFKAGKGEYWVRLMTARECARLMGVPESYKISVPLNQALFGFGDAVCVPVIEWIADHYLHPVASEMLRGRLLAPVLAG